MSFIKYTLLLAPIPVLIGSIFLMQTVNVASTVWIQQLALTFLALLACGFAVRKSRRPFQKRAYLWIVLVSIFLLSLPLLSAATDIPKRWLHLAGLQLYISALILPSILVLLAFAEQQLIYSKKWIYPAYVIVALFLALQPDASQVTAFSLAAGVALFMRKPISIPRIVTLMGLLTCTLWAWFQPDPLEPVFHVEGVIDVAMSISPVAVIAAVLGLAMPIFALIHRGITNSQHELFVVAMYYILIYVLAGATQLTPMPLLGFGAGPLLGYFILVYTTSRLRVTTTL